MGPSTVSTVHHSDKGSQYVSLAYTQRPKGPDYWHHQEVQATRMTTRWRKTSMVLYKAEVIHHGSWKNRAEVRLATLTWVDWYNNRRLLERLGHTPPAEAEKTLCFHRNDDLAA